MREGRGKIDLFVMTAEEEEEEEEEKSRGRCVRSELQQRRLFQGI